MELIKNMAFYCEFFISEVSLFFTNVLYKFLKSNSVSVNESKFTNEASEISHDDLIGTKLLDVKNNDDLCSINYLDDLHHNPSYSFYIGNSYHEVDRLTN